MPNSMKRVMVVGILTISLLITVFSLVHYINHYYDDKVDKRNTNKLDHIRILVYSSDNFVIFNN